MEFFKINAAIIILITKGYKLSKLCDFEIDTERQESSFKLSLTKGA